MIKFANTETTPLVRQMWKDCFGDTDEYIDLYFARQYKEENTLIYFSDSKAVASLQMTPYTITFYGETIPFYYLAGLCTLPECRKKGYMAETYLCRAQRDAKEMRAVKYPCAGRRMVIRFL